MTKFCVYTFDPCGYQGRKYPIMRDARGDLTRGTMDDKIEDAADLTPDEITDLRRQVNELPSWVIEPLLTK